MQIQTHILSTKPVFEIEDSLKKVFDFFKSTTFSHAAVVEEGRYLGVLSENDLESFEVDKKIESFRYNLENFFVRKETNWLEVLEKFAQNEANLLPVLGENEEVLGYYDLTDIVNVFVGTPFFTEPGGIVVLEKGINDYSFSEIAQIVESNNTKLIGAFITGIHNDVVEVTVKIGAANLNEIIQSFRRYNYHIIFGNNDDQFFEGLKQRSDYLDKYLNV